jgi:hypothetical protein
VLKGEDSSHSILKLYPLEKDLIYPSGQLSIEFNDVGLLQAIRGMGGPEGQITIICEQDQAF